MQVHALPAWRSHLTLALCTLLHAFTHAYGTLLVPLYLLMRDDLRTSGVMAVTLIVTAYGIVYCLLSYPAGILADRMDRKVLLGVGLIGNALAVALMGATHSYWLILLLGVVAGAFGSLFHPSANALAPAHYPRNPGMAIGLMGIGSGIGFFAGPRYAGWRAETVNRGWWPDMSGWQVPVFEMGLLGIAVGLLFLLIAREVPHQTKGSGEPLREGMRRRVLAIAILLGWRDFAGVATMTLVSLYLQKAHHFDVKQAGLVVGTMMLISAVANPIAVLVSGGKRRLPTLMAVLVVGGCILIFVPFVPVRWILPVLALFQVFHLGSYAVGEAAMLERISPAVRGRVIGLFLTLAGTVASSSPWVMGYWVDKLGPRALTPQGYVMPFLVLGMLMVIASFSVRLIAGMARPAVRDADVTTALSPAIEPIG